MYKQSNYIGDTVVASTVAHEQAGKPVDIHSKYPSLDTYCARSSPPRVETSCYTTVPHSTSSVRLGVRSVT